MYLPGTVGERIADLRSLKGWDQKELAARIKLAPSQLSRIESGETKNISDVTAIIAGQVRQFVLMDEGTIGPFRQLMKKT